MSRVDFVCVLCGIFHAQTVAICITTTKPNRVRKQRNGKWIQVKFSVLYSDKCGYFSLRSCIRVCLGSVFVFERVCVCASSLITKCSWNRIDTQRDEHWFFRKKSNEKLKKMCSTMLVKRHVQSYHDQLFFILSSPFELFRTKQ